MMTKNGLIFEANSLKQGRLQALTRQQLQAQATQNRERRCVAPTSLAWPGRQAYHSLPQAGDKCEGPVKIGLAKSGVRNPVSVSMPRRGIQEDENSPGRYRDTHACRGYFQSSSSFLPEKTNRHRAKKLGRGG